MANWVKRRGGQVGLNLQGGPSVRGGSSLQAPVLPDDADMPDSTTGRATVTAWVPPPAVFAPSKNRVPTVTATDADAAPPPSEKKPKAKKGTKRKRKNSATAKGGGGGIRAWLGAPPKADAQGRVKRPPRKRAKSKAGTTPSGSGAPLVVVNPVGFSSAGRASLSLGGDACHRESGMLVYAKWAPTSFADMAGNTKTRANFKTWFTARLSAVGTWKETGLAPYAMLKGPCGVGTTLSVYLLAQELGVDVLEINAVNVKAELDLDYSALSGKTTVASALRRVLTTRRDRPTVVLIESLPSIVASLEGRLGDLSGALKGLAGGMGQKRRRVGYAAPIPLQDMALLVFTATDNDCRKTAQFRKTGSSKAGGWLKVFWFNPVPDTALANYAVRKDMHTALGNDALFEALVRRARGDVRFFLNMYWFFSAGERERQAARRLAAVNGVNGEAEGEEDSGAKGRVDVLSKTISVQIFDAVALFVLDGHRSLDNKMYIAHAHHHRMLDFVFANYLSLGDHWLSAYKTAWNRGCPLPDRDVDARCAMFTSLFRRASLFPGTDRDVVALLARPPTSRSFTLARPPPTGDDASEEEEAWRAARQAHGRRNRGAMASALANRQSTIDFEADVLLRRSTFLADTLSTVDLLQDWDKVRLLGGEDAGAVLAAATSVTFPAPLVLGPDRKPTGRVFRLSYATDPRDRNRPRVQFPKSVWMSRESNGAKLRKVTSILRVRTGATTTTSSAPHFELDLLRRRQSTSSTEANVEDIKQLAGHASNAEQIFDAMVASAGAFSRSADAKKEIKALEKARDAVTSSLGLTRVKGKKPKKPKMAKAKTKKKKKKAAGGRATKKSK